MPAIWKGTISFGLVSIPVALRGATTSHDVKLHQTHGEDGGRIRYKRTCDLCGKVVPYENIVKAYDDGEHTVMLTEEDLASLPADRSREIEVVSFVPAEQVDPLRFDRSYFLEPDEMSLKPYTLLRRALEDTDRMAIAQFTLRQRTHVAALRVRDRVLVLQTLLWDDEVRTPEFPVLETVPKISDKELAMAGQLVDALSDDFDPTAFTDEHQVQLRTLIEAKLEKGDAIDTASTFGEKPEEEKAEVVDLREALRRSLEGRAEKTKGKKGA